MKFVRLSALLVALTLFGFTGTVVQAQQGPTNAPYDDMTGYENPQGRGKQLSEQQREKIRKKIETVRIWRLTEGLKLDAATSGKLASLLSSLDEQKKNLMRDHMQNMKTLRQTLKSNKPDEGRLKTVIENLETSRRAMQDLKDKEVSGLKDILTIEQQARYIVFQQEFHREMRGMMAKARSNELGRRNMGMGQGAGRGQGQGPGPGAAQDR
jgi:Spy/CpxP family protein refolding chaperone